MVGKFDGERASLRKVHDVGKTQARYRYKAIGPAHLPASLSWQLPATRESHGECLILPWGPRNPCFGIVVSWPIPEPHPHLATSPPPRFPHAPLCVHGTVYRHVTETPIVCSSACEP
ncbi:hypothetical protein BU16DRAFT_385205 [Lophium mytilinum]|uniref:Uncharacterized protein n=1 Tax=Lophium mytilinum TaxID=390894 RepID=A0A6A6QRW6_9PEZI|nr:hypothetical protein BU16DRAFT_385205 [Lophium mytilinum]